MNPESPDEADEQATDDSDDEALVEDAGFEPEAEDEPKPDSGATSAESLA